MRARLSFGRFARASYVPVALACFAGMLVPSCRPDFGERESLITRTTVLAVRGEPPETKPGEIATYTVLVADAAGPVEAPATRWAFCATPKFLTENGAVSAACLGDGIRPIGGGGATSSAPTPPDACFLFGPEIASSDLRPRDPDVTGGFYQPIRVDVLDGGGVAARAFGQERILCKPASTSAAVATELAARYRPNENPVLLPLEARVDGAPIALDAVPRGATVTLHAAWPPESAEDYVVVDLATQLLVPRRETLRVSWSSTAGSFASDRTGRGEDDRETFTENAWTAPDDARETALFVVLRDARGGVAWSVHAITTR